MFLLECIYAVKDIQKIEAKFPQVNFACYFWNYPSTTDNCVRTLKEIIQNGCCDVLSMFVLSKGQF